MSLANFTFNSTQGSRLDLTSGKIDFMEVRKGAGALLSLFGYNAGADQWIQLFDTRLGAPTATIEKTDQTSWDEGALQLDGVTDHGMHTGQCVLVALTDISTSILYVHRIDASSFSLHASLADAKADANRDIPDTSETTGTLTLLPLHTFLMPATDNYSVIVPVTGINFTAGLLVAVSTTGPLYTAGAKDVTFSGTLRA